MQIFYLTCANIEEAKKIGHHLLKKRLAACINIIPTIFSAYWWNNAIEETEEALLLIKTKKQFFQEIKTEVRKMHSYEVFALFSIAIDQVDPAFEAFVSSELFKHMSNDEK